MLLFTLRTGVEFITIEFNNYFLDYGCHLFDINENRFFDTMLRRQRNY